MEPSSRGKPMQAFLAQDVLWVEALD